MQLEKIILRYIQRDLNGDFEVIHTHIKLEYVNNISSLHYDSYS